jgi:hypothetical protein
MTLDERICARVTCPTLVVGRAASWPTATERQTAATFPQVLVMLDGDSYVFSGEDPMGAHRVLPAI